MADNRATRVTTVGSFVTMNATTKLYARAGVVPAIAAALALSSTPALAQDAAQPVPTQPAPASTQPAAPAADPLAPDPAASVPATTTSTTTTRTTTVRRAARAHAAAPKPAPVATHAARPVAARPAAAPPAPAAPAPAPAPAQPVATPVVDLSAQPAPKPTPAKPATSNSANLLPYAAGALVLLALIAIAALLASRRRRRRELEAADEDMAYESYETEPVSEAEPEPEPIIAHGQPIMAPASAFAWGSQPQVQEERAEASSTTDLDDRNPGESWVERAYRGPSPSNPSASLRNRLSRAAFFDKRERDVAAGVAEPVDPTAGLPDAMVEEQERENA